MLISEVLAPKMLGVLKPGQLGPLSSEVVKPCAHPRKFKKQGSDSKL